jgi:hypothetical protein
MGKNKDIRKKIAGLQQVLTEHEEKIKNELTKPHPNRRRIELWRKQIAGFRARLERLERRIRRSKG